MRKEMWLGALVACVAFSAQAIRTNGVLVVDLDAAALSLSDNDTVTAWANPGSAGGNYVNVTAGKGPVFNTNVGGATAVTFVAYSNYSVMTNTAAVPASICGIEPWSFEIWVYNPSLSQTEIVFSWTARNNWPGGVGTGTCAEFRYGGDTGNAIEHYGNNVSWNGTSPTVGAWHHVAGTRDAEGRECLYLDGVLRNVVSPLVMRIRTDGVFSLGGARNLTGTFDSLFSGSIARLRIHDGTLSPGDVVANYLEERAVFGVTETPDSVWAGAADAALPWETASNWSGDYLPGLDSRVAFANGGTSVLTTAVGEIGRFLPYHGTLVMSNNAVLVAPMKQAAHVYMGNYSNNLFNLVLTEGSFSLVDATNGCNLYVGVNAGSAHVTVGGGASPAILDVGRDLQLGAYNYSVGRMTVEDGGEVCASNGYIYVGVNGLADAKLTVNGGYVGHRMTGKQLVIGHNNGYGVLEVNGGFVAPSADLEYTRDGTARCYGAVQLNGGLLQARRLYPQNTTGTNILYLNGGTIRNRDTRNDFIYNLDWAYVQPGGAKFDIIPNTLVTASQPLLTDPNLGDGGLTKSGNGILVLSGANTFTGNIAVVGGHLCLSNALGLVSGYVGSISADAGASIGYATAGGVATLLSRMDASSSGSVTVYPVNAAEDVNLSSFPNLSVGFSSGVTYTGTYTPYNRQYLFAPVSPNNTYSAVIDDAGGAASVTCNGAPAGAVELTGNNAYSGGTTINGGMLSMGHVNALGDPAVVTIPDIGIYNGAALKLNHADIPASIVNRIKADSSGYIILGVACANLSLDLAGLPGVRVGTDQGTLTYGGAITPDSDAYLTGGGRVAYASGNQGLVLTNLTDNGATPRTLVVDGVGMVRAAAGNTYSGGTVVTNDGALHVREDSGLGAVPAADDPDNIYVNRGVFRPGATSFTLNVKRGLTVGPDGMILHPNGSQTMTMLGNLNGVGAITNTDSGTVVFGGTGNSWSGALTLTTGTIWLGNGANFSWNPDAKINGTGGTLGVNDNSDHTWSSNVGDSLGSGGFASLGFRKAGRGTLTVDVPQTYSGATTIDAGTLKAATGGAVPNGTSRGNLAINNQNYNPIGTLDVNGFALNVNGLSGSGCITDSTASASQILVNNNNQNSTYFGPVTPTLTLTKVGSGALNLVKGARLQNLLLASGTVTNNPGALVAGALSVSANATLMIGGNTNEVNGLLGEYYDFSNTALRWIPNVTNLDTLARFNAVIAPYAPATIISSAPVSNVFSFGSNGALFQNKGDYRVGRWTGKFLAETEGEYRFNTLSDDGSMVFVDGTMVVSNNFSQGYTTVNPKKLFPITLTAGWHDILVAYYNGTGSYGLTVFMTPPGGVEAELPQRLLRPPAAQIGELTGATTANTFFYSANAAVKFSPTGDAVYNGLFTGTNALMAIEKVGSGSQTLTRAAFLGTTDIREGTLALQNGGMFGGAVQVLNDAMSISNGAALSVRAYSPDWPNAGLGGLYYNNPNVSGTTFPTLLSITNYFNLRTPDLVMGTYQAGANFDYDPNTLFPAPYNSGTFIDFQALYQGKLVIREAGTYGFYLNSDDRSDLYIDTVQVITNVSSSTARSGVAYLTAGSHDMFVPFQQGSGGYRIYMNWTPPGGASVALPNGVLRPCAAQTGPLTAEGGAAVSLEDVATYLRVNQTADTVMAGAFDGPNGSELEKTGASRLTLGGGNDAFLGSWFVSQGELWAGDGATSGTLGGSNVYVSGGAALVFNRSDDITYAGALAGNGEIRSAGSGKVKLTGDATGFQGAITVVEGQAVTVTRTFTATNALVNNGGTFGISGSQAYFNGSRIFGSGDTRLSEGGTLSLGLQDVNFPNTLSVSNGVLALAVTNASSAWHLGRVTIEAGTALEVLPSGLWGRYYDIAGFNATTISNAFTTLEAATNYLHGFTPALIASSWETGDFFDFGRSDIGGTTFPGKYKTAAVNFVAQWMGKFRVTEPGTYTFYTTSDDNSVLFIDTAMVVNNNANHGMTTKTGSVYLDAGLHDIAIFMAQGGGGYGLYVDVTLPGQSASQRLPNAMLMAEVADTPAYTVAVDTVAVTNGPGVGTVTLAGAGVLKLTDLWIDTGTKLAVTGGVACAGSALTVTVPQEIPYGLTVVGDFTATDGLDTGGVTLTAAGTDGDLRYRNKLLYLARSNGTMIFLR